MTRAKVAASAALLVLAVILVACGSSPTLPADDVATYQMLTHGNGQGFLREISTQEWDDRGKQAAARFSWIARDAQSTNEDAAQRAGEAAHAIAKFLGDNRDDLMRVSTGWFGLQHRSLGQLNPELVRGYASALIPFQGALIGNVKPVRGFELTGDGLDQSSARSVFAVIDTDTQAGTEFKDAAYQRVHSYLRAYAEAVVGRNPDGLTALRNAADLAGVVEGGQRESGNTAVQTATAQHWINLAGYEVAAAMGVRPDGPDIPDKFFQPDGRLKSPEQVSKNDLSGFATALEIFTFNHGLQNLGSDFQHWYRDAAGK